MKYVVTSPIKFNGRRYEEGEVVDLKEEDPAIAHCLRAAEKGERKAKADKPADAPPVGEGEGDPTEPQE